MYMHSIYMCMLSIYVYMQICTYIHICIYIYVSIHVYEYVYRFNSEWNKRRQFDIQWEALKGPNRYLFVTRLCLLWRVSSLVCFFVVALWDAPPHQRSLAPMYFACGVLTASCGVLAATVVRSFCVSAATVVRSFRVSAATGFMFRCVSGYRV